MSFKFWDKTTARSATSESITTTTGDSDTIVVTIRDLPPKDAPADFYVEGLPTQTFTVQDHDHLALLAQELWKRAHPSRFAGIADDEQSPDHYLIKGVESATDNLIDHCFDTARRIADARLSWGSPYNSGNALLAWAREVVTVATTRHLGNLPIEVFLSTVDDASSVGERLTKKAQGDPQ